MSKIEVATEGFDWTSIVGQSVDAWPEPTPLPTGHWRFSVKSGKLDKAKGRVIIALSPVEPMDDVDPDEVAKLNGELATATIFANFNLSRHDDVSRIKQLLRALGLGEYNIEDGLKAIKKADLAGEVVHSPKDDGTNGVYVNVRRLGPFSA